jgi:hypothetical protein
VASCDGAPRGRCEAARFPVTDYRVEVAGPEPRAVHVISATAGAAAAAAAASLAAPAATRLGGDGWEGVHLAGPRDAVVVWPRGSSMGAGASTTLRYRAPRGPAVTHVVLAASPATGAPQLTARPDRDACAVELAIPAAPAAPAAPASTRPVIAVLDAACAVTLDPERPSGSPDAAASPSRPTSPTPPSHPPPPPARPSGGCCGAHSSSAPTSAVATSTIIGLALLRRRRRRPAR